MAAAPKPNQINTARTHAQDAIRKILEETRVHPVAGLNPRRYLQYMHHFFGGGATLTHEDFTKLSGRARNLLGSAYRENHITLSPAVLRLSRQGYEFLRGVQSSLKGRVHREGSMWRYDPYLPDRKGRYRTEILNRHRQEWINYLPWFGPPPTSELVVATDASRAARALGAAAVAEDGRWGMVSYYDHSSQETIFLAELRAIAMAVSLALPDQKVHVLTDSKDAQEQINGWKNGDLRAPKEHPHPILESSGNHLPLFPGNVKLSWLKDQVSTGAVQLTVEHVPSHSGHVLNEAADALAGMARKARQHRHPLRNATSGALLGEAAQEIAPTMAAAFREQEPRRP